MSSVFLKLIDSRLQNHRDPTAAPQQQKTLVCAPELWLNSRTDESSQEDFLLFKK